jgi:hypothetical protein
VATASDRRGTGEVGVEVNPDGARQMGGQIRVAARPAVEIPPDIGQDQAVGTGSDPVRRDDRWYV